MIEQLLTWMVYSGAISYAADRWPDSRAADSDYSEYVFVWDNIWRLAVTTQSEGSTCFKVFMTINHLFACAMVEGCSLSQAAKIIDAPQDVLIDAVCFRMAMAVDKNIDDYQQSVYESFKRLENAN